MRLFRALLCLFVVLVFSSPPRAQITPAAGYTRPEVLMLDYDRQTFANFTPSQPAQGRLALHGLIQF